MKQTAVLLALFVTLSAHTCNKKTMDAVGGDPGTGAAKITSLVDNKWVLQSVDGHAVNMPEGSEKPWLKLAKEGAKLEGFGGCNNMFGGFELDGDAVKFPNLASTKKYCEAVQPTETSFTNALRSTDHFQLDGSTLKLLQGTREIATLQPE